MQTPAGQTALSFYQTWNKCCHRHINPTSFLASKYFVTFIKFAKFVQKIQLPEPDMFIKLMVKRDLPPTLWTSDQVYAIYMEYLDKQLTPAQHAKITINTLFRLADAHEVGVGDVFKVIHCNEVIALIRERQLSPWILLFSKQFKELLISAAPEQRVILETIIRADHWIEKFKQQPEIVEQMKKYAKELDI